MVQKMSLVEETGFVYIEVLGRKTISGCRLKIVGFGSKSVFTCVTFANPFDSLSLSFFLIFKRHFILRGFSGPPLWLSW